MPTTNNNRESLSKDLLTRYQSQRAGGAFDVKDVLKSPGNNPAAGTVINSTSMRGTQFQSPSGFEVKINEGMTQFKDAQGTVSKQLSLYLKGFNNIRYKR